MSEDYKLISYEAYTKNGMKTYRKVRSPMKDKCAVMYYFMRNDYSNNLYKVKIVGEIERQDMLINIAENIANTVKII